MSERRSGTGPDEQAIRDALRKVIDPEAGMNVVDLGLVYGVRVNPSGIEVDLTMTSPACPMGEMIVREAREALAALAEAGGAITVNLVWDPPWSADRMSEAAKRHFGWNA